MNSQLSITQQDSRSRARSPPRRRQFALQPRSRNAFFLEQPSTCTSRPQLKRSISSLHGSTTLEMDLEGSGAIDAGTTPSFDHKTAYQVRPLKIENEWLQSSDTQVFDNNHTDIVCSTPAASPNQAGAIRLVTYTDTNETRISSHNEVDEHFNLDISSSGLNTSELNQSENGVAKDKKVGIHTFQINKDLLGCPTPPQDVDHFKIPAFLSHDMSNDSLSSTSDPDEEYDMFYLASPHEAFMSDDIDQIQKPGTVKRRHCDKNPCDDSNHEQIHEQNLSYSTEVPGQHISAKRATTTDPTANIPAISPYLQDDHKYGSV